MTTRDLSLSFQTLRSEIRSRSTNGRLYRGKNLEDSFSIAAREPLLFHGPDSEEKNLSPSALPNWALLANMAKENLRKIEIQMDMLSQLHRNRLLVRFDGAEADQEEEIDAHTKHIKEIFLGSEQLLRGLSLSGGFATQSDAEKTLRMNIQRSMATKLQATSAAFRRSQKEYMKALAAQKNFGTSQLSINFGDSDLESNQPSGVYADEDMLITNAEVSAAERDHEMQNILTSIIDLSSIFKDLSNFVVDQGTILDRVDYNMEQTLKRMRMGVEYLHAAERLQKPSTRALKCISFLLFSIFLSTVLLILKHK